MASAMMGDTRGQIERLFAAGGVAGLDDGRLLERFAAGGDESAFAALVARHGPMVQGTCRAVLRDAHDAEDAFQATFLVLARKAGTVRVADGGSLGGWLYRVASRVASQARADRLRRRGREVPTPDPSRAAAAAAGIDRAGPWDDWLPTLHEEIARLPERHRAPIVLCDLQGLTYDQAARQLRWTPPTLRCRLAAARARLRDRLSRRGLGVTGAVAALAAGRIADAATASVPESWARAAIRAASGGATPAAIALSARLLRATRLGRLAWLAVVLSAAGASAFVAVSIRHAQDGRDPGPPPAIPSAPATGPTASRATAAHEDQDKPGEAVAVRGRVVDPAGRPVAGATVRVEYYAKPRGGGPSAVSGADGRYTLVSPRDILERFAKGEARFPDRLVATAPGYGPGWAEAADNSGARKDVTVRLAADDRPIEGRILDLEGRPVAGAEVVTSDLFGPPGGDLTPWYEGMKANPSGPHEGDLQEIPFATRRTTGPDGRFRIDGAGRERVVMFTVSGPTIAFIRAFAMTKDVPPVRSSNTHVIGPETMVFHGARFDFAVAPCKPVLGTVRDLDTGEPLAGVRVNGMAYDERNTAYYHEIVSTTDDQGRYRLDGMSKGEKYRLFLSPGEGQRYCNASFTKPGATPGLEPVTIDLRLKRAALIRGRITDKRTGKPVKGGIVESFAMEDNPRVNEYPGFRDGYPTTVYPDEDGRFAIAAVPGRGMLGIRAGSERYLTGVGAEALQGEGPDAPLAVVPGFQSAGVYNLIVPFDAGTGPEPVALDLQLDPGRTLSMTVVDPEGKPVPGCRAFGAHSLTYWNRRPLDAATFEVTGLDPRQARLVMVYHEGRRIGGSATITKDEEGPLTLRLRPRGVVTGRLVDEDGQPRTKLEVVNAGFLDDEPIEGVFHRRYPVDQDGRFRVEVIPGLNYTVGAQNEGGRIVGKVFAKLALGPGEFKDLGDVIVKKSEEK